jgi:hypothetical protein
MIDRAVASVGSRFGFLPLLCHGHWPISNFWSYSTKLLLGENVPPKFEDIEHKEIYLPSLSGQKGGWHSKRQVNKRGFLLVMIGIVLQH